MKRFPWLWFFVTMLALSHWIGVYLDRQLSNRLDAITAYDEYQGHYNAGILSRVMLWEVRVRETERRLDELEECDAGEIQIAPRNPALIVNQ